MAKSLLHAFVSSARSMLAAQLIVSIGVVAIAGWTLGVTDDLIRERNRLQERVIQLEEIMATRGDVPPPAPAVVNAPAPQADDYPPSIDNAVMASAFGQTNADAQAADTIEAEPARVSANGAQRDIGSIVTGLFGPAPPVRIVVLHVRSQADALIAAPIAAELEADSGARVFISVLPASDTRQSGYAYFDGRQSRAAANLVSRFHDGARAQQIAQWSAQLRGTALPARTEYGADRLDIVLPALPAPAPVTPAPAAAITVP